MSYAADFVITGRSKELLEQEVFPWCWVNGNHKVDHLREKSIFQVVTGIDRFRSI